MTDAEKSVKNVSDATRAPLRMATVACVGRNDPLSVLPLTDDYERLTMDPDAAAAPDPASLRVDVRTGRAMHVTNGS